MNSEKNAKENKNENNDTKTDTFFVIRPVVLIYDLFHEDQQGLYMCCAQLSHSSLLNFHHLKLEM